MVFFKRLRIKKPTSIIYLAMYVCLFICMFAIGARTVGARGLKFGTELGFHPESVLG